MAGDIRETAEADRLVSETLARRGRLDFLLNNAGGQYFVPAEGITTKGWHAVQRLNVGGTYAMSEAAHRLAMAPAGAGTIVNVTVSPHHGMPAMAHTGAARAAVEALDPGAGRALGAGRRFGVCRGDRALRHGIAAQVPGGALAAGRRVSSASAPGEMQEYGWLVALLATSTGRAFSGSVLTLDGALDNWTGRWPPEDLIRDGQVPTEARRQPPAGRLD